MHKMSCKHCCFVRKCPLIFSDVQARCSSVAELNLYRSDIISCALQLYFENCGARNWWQHDQTTADGETFGHLFLLGGSFQWCKRGQKAASMLWINGMITDIIFAGRHVEYRRRAGTWKGCFWRSITLTLMLALFCWILLCRVVFQLRHALSPCWYSTIRCQRWL